MLKQHSTADNSIQNPAIIDGQDVLEDNLIFRRPAEYSVKSLRKQADFSRVDLGIVRDFDNELIVTYCSLLIAKRRQCSKYQAYLRRARVLMLPSCTQCVEQLRWRLILSSQCDDETCTFFLNSSVSCVNSCLACFMRIQQTFLARDSIYAIARSLLTPVRPPVCPAVCPPVCPPVCHTGGSVKDG